MPVDQQAAAAGLAETLARALAALAGAADPRVAEWAGGLASGEGAAADLALPHPCLKSQELRLETTKGGL
jgi:hypothetical protein